jgi:hypothetical protein
MAGMRVFLLVFSVVLYPFVRCALAAKFEGSFSLRDYVILRLCKHVNQIMGLIVDKKAKSQKLSSSALESNLGGNSSALSTLTGPGSGPPSPLPTDAILPPTSPTTTSSPSSRNSNISSEPLLSSPSSSAAIPSSDMDPIVIDVAVSGVQPVTPPMEPTSAPASSPPSPILTPTTPIASVAIPTSTGMVSVPLPVSVRPPPGRTSNGIAATASSLLTNVRASIGTSGINASIGGV